MGHQSWVDSLSTQAAIVFSAPIPFLVCVGLVGVAVWRILDWRYSAIIERLREERDALRKKVAEKAEVDQPKEAIPAQEAGGVSRRVQQSAWNDFRSVAIRAQQTLASNWATEGNCARHVADIRASLLAMQKAFAMPIPDASHSAKGEVVHCVALWLKIDALMERGHFPEARQIAAEYTQSLRDHPAN